MSWQTRAVVEGDAPFEVNRVTPTEVGDERATARG